MEPDDILTPVFSSPFSGKELFFPDFFSPWKQGSLTSNNVSCMQKEINCQSAVTAVITWWHAKVSDVCGGMSMNNLRFWALKVI